MSAQNIEARVARVIAEHGGLAQADVKQGSTLAEHGLDSLDVTEIEMNLQDEFGVTLPDEIDDLTVAQICALVGNQIGAVA